MNKITVSAPGKLMLLGEHTVVYDRPCIVTAVEQRMKVAIEKLADQKFVLNSPEVQIKNYQKPTSKIGLGKIPKGARFVEIATANFLKRYPIKNGLTIEASSEFSSKFGLGSSSAATVCIIFALARLFKIKLAQQQIFDLSYKTALDIQGKGSGFDVAASIYGGTLYFLTGGKIIKPLKVNSIPLIVGYTGIKSDTVTIINQVAEKSKKYPEIIENIYDQIAKLVEKAKVAIEKNDWQTLGELMDINQGYLETLGVSSVKLSAMVYAARDNGAYGAKLSGAGIGDCMIAISPPSKIKAVKLATQKAGGKIIDVKTDAEGVRTEK